MANRFFGGLETFRIMKTINPLLKAFALIASALIGCTLNLHAQSPPTMTTQPSSQTNLVGTGVNFTVTAGGAGPFTYHWQFNGTNLPSIITTVAGNGTGTYAGDGGAATNASLNTPFSVAFDASGGLYIADTINNRVRKVDTSGVITTVAGNGIKEPRGRRRRGHQRQPLLSRGRRF